MLSMKETVLSLKENNRAQHLFFFFKIARKYKRSCMTVTLNIIFDDFSI